MPMVSIIMPFHNAEQHLAEAIASVQDQTCTDWELVLIDDGSTDGSHAITSEAAKADPRVRLLARHAGASGNAAAARNLGIREARGEFVGFLDADDVYEPDSLSGRIHAFDIRPESMMVYGPTRWWHPGATDLDWTEGMRKEAGRVHQAPGLLNRVVLMQRGHVPCICSVLIRREALDRVGGFDETFHLYEDQTLWVKILLRFPVYVTDMVGARYRQHNASATARSEQSGEYDRMRPHPARLAFLTWVRDYARSGGLADAPVERALRRAFASYGEGRALLTPVDRLSLAVDGLKMKLRSIIRDRSSMLSQRR